MELIAALLHSPEVLFLDEPTIGLHARDNDRLISTLRRLSDIGNTVIVVEHDLSVLDYFLVADEGLVVVRPEPTSVENAYTFLRAAFYRRLRLAMVGHGVRQQHYSVSQ